MPEPVKRYRTYQGDADASEHPDGEYVKHTDYDALAQRLAVCEVQLGRMVDLADALRRLYSADYSRQNEKADLALIDEARAVLTNKTAAPASQGWRDWASVPRDGTEVLICYPQQPRVYSLVSYNQIHGYWLSKGTAKLGLDNQGCLWMPIPAYVTPPREEG